MEKISHYLSKMITDKLNIGSTTAALQVLEPDDISNFKINEQALETVLLDPRVADKPVMPVVVVGPFRKGKSFLLNFLIRYLEHQCAAEEGSGSGEWLEISAENGEHINSGGGWLDLEKPLRNDFEYKSGSKAHTKGIFLWPEPFALKDSNGQEVVVLLVDSQGNFDPSMGAAQNSAIFALSSLFSSVLIYNIKENIGNDHLESLQFFASYAEMLSAGNELSSSAGKIAAFQNLIFLVRDWELPDEMPFGFVGGQQLIEQNLPEFEEKVSPEVKRLRQDVRRLFGSIQAFLMPHPGSKVSNGKFSGNLKEIKGCFLEQIGQFCECLFSNTVVKRIGGTPVTGSQLLVYFQAYFCALSDVAQPEPKSLLRATVEANLFLARTKSMDLYRERIDLCADGTKSSKELEILHGQYRQEALQLFKDAKKIGAPEDAAATAAELQTEIDDRFIKHILRINDLKAEQTKLEQQRFAEIDLSHEEMRKELERVKKELQSEREKMKRADEEAAKKKKSGGCNIL